MIDFRQELLENGWSKIEEENPAIPINEDSMMTLIEADVSQSFFTLEKLGMVKLIRAKKIKILYVKFRES